MTKKSTLFLVAGIICATLLGGVIITIFHNENGQNGPEEDNLINSSKKPEADPRIDKTKAACKDYSSNTILKEYGNLSKRIYYDQDSWSAICPQDTVFDKYGASNGGPITGCGPDSCTGGIFLWWDPDIPVNETVMDEVYSLFVERAKANDMEEPYLIFTYGKLITD